MFSCPHWLLRCGASKCDIYFWNTLHYNYHKPCMWQVVCVWLAYRCAGYCLSSKKTTISSKSTYFKLTCLVCYCTMYSERQKSCPVIWWKYMLMGIKFWCDMSCVIWSVRSNDEQSIWQGMAHQKFIPTAYTVGLFLPDFTTWALSFTVLWVYR